MSGKVSSVGNNGVQVTRSRLADKRRSQRRSITCAWGILFLLISAILVYGLRQDSVRISNVSVFLKSESVTSEPLIDKEVAITVISFIATRAMGGNYIGIIPRNSIFLFSKQRIREFILPVHPEIAAVSISRTSLTSIALKVDYRVPVARWCGTFSGIGSEIGPEVSTTEKQCYFFDSLGFVFALAPSFIPASTSEMAPIQSVNSFALYAPLDENNFDRKSDKGEPDVLKENSVGKNISNFKNLPEVFNFARQIATFGSPVTMISISEDNKDEVNFQVESGTRLTYVLGNEQNSFTTLISAREKFNLVDGSLEYLDLRFDGKIYLKKR